MPQRSARAAEHRTTGFSRARTAGQLSGARSASTAAAAAAARPCLRAARRSRPRPPTWPRPRGSTSRELPRFASREGRAPALGTNVIVGDTLISPKFLCSFSCQAVLPVYSHRDLLIRLQQLYSLYLVTDGHKITQQRKVEALGVATYFKRIFITHQFGIVHAKPSLYCFEQIKKAEGCEWADILYLGDNPAKDFVSLNQVGAVTVRVRTGAHASVVGKPGFDATHHIERLTDFETLLSHLTG